MGHISWALQLCISVELLGRQDLPNSTLEFSVMLERVFGSVYDVKYMARFCKGLMGGELGL